MDRAITRMSGRCALIWRVASQQLDTLADAEQAEPRRRFQRAWIKAATAIRNRQTYIPSETSQPDHGLFDSGVLDDVEQSLLPRLVEERAHGIGLDVDPAVGIHLDD